MKEGLVLRGVERCISEIALKQVGWGRDEKLEVGRPCLVKIPMIRATSANIYFTQHPTHSKQHNHLFASHSIKTVE